MKDTNAMWFSLFRDCGATWQRHPKAVCRYNPGRQPESITLARARNGAASSRFPLPKGALSRRTGSAQELLPGRNVMAFPRMH